MTAPKLTALGTVQTVGGGRVVTASGAWFRASSDEEQAYGAMLYQQNAVRITIEPAAADEAPAAAPRSAEEVAREAVTRRCWLGVETTSEPEDVDRARSALARLIEQARAEGAAAERERADRLLAERDEARAWVRRLTAAERVLTCVYCGQAYPPGTPDHGADVLTAHVRVCEKHPMREVEAELARLRERDAAWQRETGSDSPEVVSGAMADAFGEFLELGKRRALASQQPRDLAGRIRALIDLHVTRWLEPQASLESDRSSRRRANGILSALEWLKGAHAAALAGDLREVRAIIDDLRDTTHRSDEAATVLRKAADDLERIARECGEAQR